MNGLRAPMLGVLLGCSTLLLGCRPKERNRPVTAPGQDAAEARELLVGKWEDESGEVPMGFEFKETGEAIYLTRMVQREARRDGRPVQFIGRFEVPEDNELMVTWKTENGSEGAGYRFTVTEDEISFYKKVNREAEVKVGGMRRVKA